MGWLDIAQAKRNTLLELIPPQWRLASSQIPSGASLRDVTDYVCRFLHPRELDITNSSVTTILDNIHSLKWTALDVTRAFCHRAALAHQLTNCLSEICFTAAEQRARWLDDYLRDHGRVIGPLHGLPVSVKDRFNIAGLDSTCGYISLLEQKRDSESEGALVKSLRNMGAVFFVKTNVPMSMLMGETTNNIIGSTINPYNRNLSCGGASGGEGALLAMRGSPIGWGSDIAGSVRIPCGFNNLYGIRPSFGRLPASGLVTSLPGLPVADSVVGPMSPDITSLILMTKTVLESSPWNDDIDVIEMPWRDTILQSTRNRSTSIGQGKHGRRLVFGLMTCDGTVMPHPPVQRALEIVRNALLQRGCEVVDWEPPSHNEACDLLFQILGSTAGQKIRTAIDASGEPPMPQMRDWYIDSQAEPSSSAEFWDLCQKRYQFRKLYHEYWMNSRERSVGKQIVDGVIMPVAPSAAVVPGDFSYYGKQSYRQALAMADHNLVFTAYTAIVNLLDYTAVSFPVTFADRSLDLETPNYQPMNSRDESIWRTYRRDLFDGAPVGLQVMGRRLQEEKVLGLAEAITNALQEFTGT